MNLRINNRHHIIIFSILLFIAAQYSAVVHASGHYFHTPDKLCKVYSAIEHDKTGMVAHNITVPVISVHAQPPVRKNYIVTTAYFIFLPSRAPPRV